MKPMKARIQTMNEPEDGQWVDTQEPPIIGASLSAPI